MSDCKYKLRKLSVGLVSVGTMFTATTVMGNEVSQPTTTEVTTPPVAVESSSTSATPSESTMTEAQAPTTTTKAETAEATQPEPTKVESEQVKDEKISETTASSQESSAPKVSPRSKRSTDSASEQPQLMEVETITVDKEKTELNLKDGNGNKKLIKNRDGEQREIVDISREVKVDESKNELEVTLTVTPKEIDKGAEVIILLDTSKKMTDEDFNSAKDNIKKLVTTLTGKTSDTTSNYNARNSVRLIDFYRHVGDPIELTINNVDTELTKVRKKAIDDYNGWGVDLQGAIHKAREIFNKEKNSGKRQHIVLFSQGEATFSYDIIKDKSKLSQNVVKNPITSSNPLLPWPLYFDSTASSANLVEDGKRIQEFLKKLGIKRYKDLLDGVADTGNSFLSIGSDILGTNNPLDYITLADLDTKTLSEKDFDYSKVLGEGYHFRSYYTRESNDVPLKEIVRKAVKQKIDNLKKKAEEEHGWLDVLGISKWSNSISKALGLDKVEEQMINKVIDYLFYKRNYIYYNHNLSAQAEAKMARDEGITFYAFDVTDPNQLGKETKSNNHSEAYTKYLDKKAEETKKIAKERNDKFDKYLKEMSEGNQFLKGVNDKDRFKDVLSELKIIDKFDDKVTAKKDSWKITGENDAVKVSHTSASTGWLGSTSESLTWTISKEQMQKAFESGTPLILTYKLDVNNAKFKASLDKRRKKRSASTDTNDSLTEKIISNQISYQINKKSANGQKLDDVKLTYGKEMVPVPEIEGEVIEPQVPQSPELPPIIDHGPNLDFEEETIHQLPIEHGQYDNSTQTTLTEDSKPEETDTIIGGNVIDITEDSITDNQHTESGENSTDHNQEIIEDTKPESDTISVGGQSDPIDITEDTLSNLSGQSNNDATDDTIIEDTRQTDVIIGGQANSVDMVEETQPGMSGFNEATVIEEDTRPKLQFHFDNEESIPAVNKAISQTPVTRADNNLPQTGDKDTLEAFFTITALTVIGAAGLLNKKDRKNQID
uniref:serum opacification factor n=1 Tax=Streptococcus canis TaxID=1329 RepID=UPI00294AA26B|nr:serum opacification factor [Streptococcus canis]